MDRIIYDVAKKLIGPINTVGESHEDHMRFDNLETTIYLVNRLLFDISRIREDKDRQEYSMAKAGKRAAEFLDSLQDNMDE